MTSKTDKISRRVWRNTFRCVRDILNIREGDRVYVTPSAPSIKPFRGTVESVNREKGGALIRDEHGHLGGWDWEEFRPIKYAPWYVRVREWWRLKRAATE